MKKTTTTLVILATSSAVCIGLTGCGVDQVADPPPSAVVSEHIETPEKVQEVEPTEEPSTPETQVESPMATLSPEKYLAALEWDRLSPSPTWMMDTYLNEAGFTQEEKDWFFVKSGFNPGNNAYKEQASITGFKTWDYVYERLSGMGYTENEINYATSPEGGIKDYDPNVTYEGRR